MLDTLGSKASLAASMMYDQRQQWRKSEAGKPEEKLPRKQRFMAASSEILFIAASFKRILHRDSDESIFA